MEFLVSRNSNPTICVPADDGIGKPETPEYVIDDAGKLVMPNPTLTIILGVGIDADVSGEDRGVSWAAVGRGVDSAVMTTMKSATSIRDDEVFAMTGFLVSGDQNRSVTRYPRADEPALPGRCCRKNTSGLPSAIALEHTRVRG
jgi:hypothetical protein